MPTLAPGARCSSTGAGTSSARRLPLAVQPVHVAEVVVRTFASTAPARCVRCRAQTTPHWDAGCRAACGSRRRRRPRPCSAQSCPVAPALRFAQHLAAVQRSLGIGKRIAHPVVHAQVQVAHHEHRSLQLLGQVEGVHGKLKALAHRCRKQHRMLGVAMR